MKRLLRHAIFHESQVKDAVNKAVHFKNQQTPAFDNAEKVLGNEQAHGYVIALILTYNGEEQELENELNNFLFNGVMQPNVYEKVQEIIDSWQSFLEF